MSKKQCIYCGTTERLTESDIIPDALTNARIINDCVCQDLHNSKMTEKFESIIAKRLAFMTNELDIKSSKSKSYANYSASIEIEGNKYEAKKLKGNDDFLKKGKVLWNKEHTQAFGDIDTIRAIAKSNGINESKVRMINSNDIEFIKTLKIDLEVFFSVEMYRQIAKIAFEWYCAQNKVSRKYEDFNEIINYIVDGVGENIVSIVSDIDINNTFNEYCNSGSHCLVGYVSNEGDVNVFVDMFGIIVYNVKICNNILDFCPNNCLLQKLNLDTTRQSFRLHDYNDLPIDMISTFSAIDDRFPQPIINGVKVYVPTMSKDVSGHIFFMKLLRSLSNGFLKECYYTEKIGNTLINNIEELLQGSVVHRKALKRFVTEKINFSKGIALSSTGTDKKSIFIYYLLFILGKQNPDKMNKEILEKIIFDNFGNYQMIITDKLCEEIKDTILKDDNYRSIIIIGSKKVLDWQ
ncbi:hypothetical protein H7E67_17885 [Clostridium gasigenes]|uniref:hypothetical protein n=1 Tax=Clostridium gasigenes TaxID=94869 RepID=UPI001627D9E0|nr:hypothetical protein [Clostridium gasigenes]MBB6625289.1 hypothetical protein [Clostridium gasigenes]